MGVIEKSWSPFNVPVFTVPKKNLNPDDPTKPNLRVVLDFRKLNDNIKDECYHLRDVDTLIQEIGINQSKVFSSIDTTHAFWSLDLAEISREKTAFTVPGHSTKYQWTRIPMGVKTSPLAYANCMENIFGDLSYDITKKLHTAL